LIVAILTVTGDEFVKVVVCVIILVIINCAELNPL